MAAESQRMGQIRIPIVRAISRGNRMRGATLKGIVQRIVQQRDCTNLCFIPNAI